MKMIAYFNGRIVMILPFVAALSLLACSTSSAANRSGSARRDQPATATTPAGEPSSIVQTPVEELPGLIFTTSAGDLVTMLVEIADTEALREIGLMNRTSMADDHGMIFMFTREVAVPFWMKDTLIDLSVAFVDGHGAIVDIQEMTALSLDNHFPALPYQFAIEANATWYARHGLAVGDRVDVGQALSKSAIFGGASPVPGGTP